MKYLDLPWTNLPESLRKQDLSQDPFVQLERWLGDAKKAKIPGYNAMSLATSSISGKPSCRIVLLKELDELGLAFFTNYQSRKALELTENPRAMVTFYWQPLVRQVCVEGKVQKTSQEESAYYFSQRPRGSQLVAWASQQGAQIASMGDLEAQLKILTEKYEGEKIPLPPFWGGFRIIPERFEFWQGGKDRMHDRFAYTKTNGSWVIERLSP